MSTITITVPEHTRTLEVEVDEIEWEEDVEYILEQLESCDMLEQCAVNGDYDPEWEEQAILLDSLKGQVEEMKDHLEKGDAEKLLSLCQTIVDELL